MHASVYLYRIRIILYVEFVFCLILSHLWILRNHKKKRGCRNVSFQMENDPAVLLNKKAICIFNSLLVKTALYHAWFMSFQILPYYDVCFILYALFDYLCFLICGGACVSYFLDFFSIGCNNSTRIIRIQKPLWVASSLIIFFLSFSWGGRCVGSSSPHAGFL